MRDTIPACPKCKSEYAYEDRNLFNCPECGNEWDPDASDDDVIVLKDSVGNLLAEGDKVTLIKDLKVKGTSTTLKVGTKATIKRFVDGDHDIDCKVDGAGAMMLKSKFVRKA